MEEDAAHTRGDAPHHADLAAQAGVLVAVLNHHLHNQGVQDVDRAVGLITSISGLYQSELPSMSVSALGEELLVMELRWMFSCGADWIMDTDSQQRLTYLEDTLGW